VVNAFKNVAIGIIIFIVTLTLINTMVLGTDTASNLVRTLVPLAVGVGVAIFAVVALLGAGSKAGVD
jgi:hypothetical protein